ncbi:MAG: hypothetical protein WCT26_02660 [Candidatus Buchananbacteria bacterium]
MEKIGDEIFKCRNCEHIEFGCTHSRPETRNGTVICSICFMENPVQPDLKPLSTEEIAKLLGADRTVECNLIGSIDLIRKRHDQS